MDRNTLNLYRFEVEYFPKNHYLLKSQPISTLQNLGEKIWYDYNVTPRKMPLIRFGAGYYCYSWTDGDVIELAPWERNKLVLIHEMTHILGYPNHDKHFVRLYMELLMQYTPIKEMVLLGGLTFYNISH